MLQWAVSRTVSLLGVAVLLHLAVIASVAEQDSMATISAAPSSTLPTLSAASPSVNVASASAAAAARAALLAREARSYEGRRAGKHRGGAAGSGGDAAGNLVAGAAGIFATDNSSVVAAQLGGTATLPCVVRKSGSNGVVSWIRRKDYHLLTVGLATYTGDDRFTVVHTRHLQSWGLQIKFVQPRDAGMYECQVSTHPPTSIFIELKVTEAEAEILGAPDLHLKSGSQLRLVCSLRHSTEAPLYVFWYHEERMINYDKERGVTVTHSRSGSVLKVPKAEQQDSGNYTCAPSNAKAASVTVHVLNGEKPAAMQHGSRSGGSPPPRLATALSSLIILLLPFLQQTSSTRR